MHTKAIYEAQRATSQDKRVVLLPRSAWAGSQRNSVVSWTSDIDQTWKVLAWQIEGLQNYSITGLPYITTDVGGYNPRPEADRELFVRWFEWGTFCPIFRVHGVGRPFPWEYGAEGDAIFKKFDNLRYSLLPYTYSEASRVTFDHGTLMRPLVMDFLEDAKAVATWDEFLFGSSILVCPVYQSTRESVGVPAQFADVDGRTGFLTANYLKDGATAAVPRKINPGLEIEDGPAEERDGAHGVRLSGTFTPTESGSLALEISEPHQQGFPATATIEGKPVASLPVSGDWQFPLFPFEAKAGVPVHFSFEGKMTKPGFRIVKVTGPVQREVYLPGKDAWVDFWTGKPSQGGQTLKVDAPLDMIPLYVRAGSILPLSPGLQYAAENPDAPIELRVYPGKDGSYALYEDEEDNYHYEKGARASIPLQWNEQTQTLTLGARKGTFPGLKPKQTFRIVWVSSGHGVGENKTDQADAEVVYEGKETSVKRPGGTAAR
jgi:alpha-D-xyloside xylohydrolase